MNDVIEKMAEAFSHAIDTIDAASANELYVKSMRAALAAAEEHGYVLVPKVATEEMNEAGWIDKEDVDPRDIWREMLAARPKL